MYSPCFYYLRYGSAVSRETVRITLTLSALNGIEVRVGDVKYTYIAAPVKGEIWTISGPGHGEDAGK